MFYTAFLHLLLSNFATISSSAEDGIPTCDSPPAQSGLEEGDKEMILMKHNFYRAEIREGAIEGLPKAREMPDLEWDEALASEAQRWADICPRHDRGVRLFEP